MEAWSKAKSMDTSDYGKLLDESNIREEKNLIVNDATLEKYKLGYDGDDDDYMSIGQPPPITLDTGLGGFNDHNRPKWDNLKDLENVPCEPFPLVPGSEGTHGKCVFNLTFLIYLGLVPLRDFLVCARFEVSLKPAPYSMLFPFQHTLKHIKTKNNTLCLNFTLISAA